MQMFAWFVYFQQFFHNWAWVKQQKKVIYFGSRSVFTSVGGTCREPVSFYIYTAVSIGHLKHSPANQKSLI